MKIVKEEYCFQYVYKNEYGTVEGRVILKDFIFQIFVVFSYGLLCL